MKYQRQTFVNEGRVILKIANESKFSLNLKQVFTG